ncbi:two-component hybrid sensor and regulator [Luteitalea sp. TBR-22]|uniref:hybrid sensor histidine kinase/response regulator n=1 Tax=Luteitalea sp. TBR-22 TaxID=2802971 RepID=UPI001AF1ACD9|nr:ATP-binding protein [Luteitalea sp. TBR-22]BCS34236.1 two-component hybrid sensor and regulator [Luteitalea sp. TBR-22]
MFLSLPAAALLLGAALAGAALAMLGCHWAGRVRRAHAARVEAIVAHSIDAAYRRDLRTDTYDYLSPALERVMGVPAPVLQAMPLDELIDRIHPEDRARVGTVVEASTRMQRGRVEYRFRADSGEYRWIADHWAVEPDAEGRPAFRSGILRDVSEQKATEAALRASEARYHMLFDSIEDGFCIVEVLLDAQGEPRDYRFLEANPAFDGATGLREPVGRTALELVPGLDRWWVRAYGRVALTGEPARFENYAAAMQRWFDVYAFRFGDPEARQVAIFFKNVTERKRNELERAALLQRERHARTEAERASRLKDDFLATISHELRTPLNAMLGWAQILARGADETTIAQGLGAIERNALAQARLIEDLLDMSRIVTGTIRLDVQPVDMRRVIANAVETARPAAEAKGIGIAIMLDEGATAVRGDATRLPQVVWNLLSNAVKFTPRGGEVHVRLEAAGPDVRLTITDTGEGIAGDFLPHVFERFRQADASTTRMHGGLGLGLAIVKQIVELHGGQVSARSEGADRGATFVVTLPRQPVAPPAPPDDHEVGGLQASHPPSTQPEVSLADVTVLAVDDEPDALAVIRRVLEDHEARVLTATSAHEAVTLCAREHPHVLLADIGMPHVDGYDLIKQVRALGAEGGGSVPAAALTAFARSEDRTRALLAGYQTHLAKPVQPVELVAAVASLAGRV